MAHTIYFTREDLKARIEETLEHIDILHARREELVLLHSALEGKEDSVIDNRGKVINMRKIRPPSDYQKNLPRENLLARYRKAGVIPRYEKRN